MSSFRDSTPAAIAGVRPLPFASFPRDMWTRQKL